MRMLKWGAVLAATATVSGCFALATLPTAEATPTSYTEVAWFTDATYTTAVGWGGSNCNNNIIHLWGGIKTQYMQVTGYGDCEW